jgi:hypothetical protein
LKAFTKYKTISKATPETTLPISNRQARKGVRKFVRVHCENEMLGVSDSKLGNIIKDKFVLILETFDDRQFTYTIDQIANFCCLNFELDIEMRHLVDVKQLE